MNERLKVNNFTQLWLKNKATMARLNFMVLMSEYHSARTAAAVKGLKRVACLLSRTVKEV